ncbi:MAG: cohesin domain-containing protein, partial [Chloroflexota bacterium]
RTGAQTGSTLSINPAAASIEVGGSLDFEVVIEIEEGRNYAGGSYVLRYDDTVLELDSFALGAGFFGSVNTQTSGEIRFNTIDLNGREGAVVLGSGTFRGVVLGTSLVDLQLAEAPTIVALRLYRI